MAMTAARFAAYRENVSTIGKTTILVSHLNHLNADMMNFFFFFFFLANCDIMSGIFWSTLEVTTAFIIINIPSTKLVLQKHLPSIKQHMNCNVPLFKSSKGESVTSSKALSSVSTQGTETANTPGPHAEKPAYENGRFQVLHLDEQGRPKLSNLNTYHI